MNSFTVSIVNETQKLLLKKKTMAMLGIAAVLPLLVAIAASGLEKSFGVVAAVSGDFPIFVLGFFTSLILPLFICMAAADMFSGETPSKECEH